VDRELSSTWIGGLVTMSAQQLGVLLACFDGQKAAGKARHDVDGTLESQGDDVLDTVVLRVNDKGKASVHDPRRVFWNVVSPAIAWGVFGLVLGSDGVASAVIWGVLGAICGGLYGYYGVHHLDKAQLTRVGSKLPADSSALVAFVATNDAARAIAATDAHQPSVTSIAMIDRDLTARQLGGVEHPPAASEALNMIMLRYPDPDAARKVAKKMTAHGKGQTSPFEVDSLITCDADGKGHVVDPTFGVAGFTPSDAVGWGGLGLIVGAIAGATTGGGWLGVVEGGLKTAIVWGLFGVAAGVLYGVLAGRVVSARKLRRAGVLLTPRTSMVLAWAGALTSDALVPFETADSRQLVLRFDAVDHGAVVQAPPAAARTPQPVTPCP
jgi:hypothetical protein